MKNQIKAFSLILVIGSAAIILLIGVISIFASHSLLIQVLPAFLGQFREWIAWILAIAIIVGIQVGECRPIYLRHLHTKAQDLHHQGASPGNSSPTLKPLQMQLGEEVGMDRSSFLWAKAFAVAITLVDFVWSCCIFPPFKVGNDFGRIWSELLRSGLGALDWFHVLMIIGNIALIPLCYMVYINELSILTSGKKDK